MRAVLWPSFLWCTRRGVRMANIANDRGAACVCARRKREEEVRKSENARRLTIALAEAGEALRAATARA
jgi:hypothetical protein